MAVDIGPRIGIEGEAEYRKQLNDIINQTKTLHAEMRAMESSFDKDTSAKQKATQQTELLNKQIDQQKRKVDEVRKAVEYSSEAYGENDNRTLRWRQALANAETELNNLQRQLKEIPNGLQIMGKQMQEVGEKVTKVGKAMSSVGGTLAKTVTAPLVGMGAAAVKTTADFDSSMSKVQALSGATGSDFDKLRKKAREMGASTKYSAGESADALSYMALAGWDTNQMLDGLEGVMDLAAASGMDLADASDLVTDYLSAFGLEAKDSAKMADQLAYAQAHSNTTTAQLGEAFGNSAAQMHTAGQSMETTTAILEAFANQGLKGSEAGTALSAMVRDLSKHMKNGKIQIGETAIQVMDANGNFRNMTDILADVEAATDGMGSAEKDMALRMVFGDRSIKGVSMALTEGSSSIKRYEQNLYSANGTAKTMAETMQDNLAGQLTILKSQVQELGISFGDILVPHIRKAVSWVQEQVEKFNSLDDATKEQIVKFGMLAAAIGPVLMAGGKLVTGVGNMITTGGKAIEWLGKVTSGFGGASSAVGSAVAALGPFAGAVGVAIGAGALLGFALKELTDKYGGTQSAISQFNEDTLSTVETAKKAREAISNTTDDLERTTDNAQKIMAEAETAAELTDRYADELYELAEKSDRTTEEQRRLEAIISQLNEIYPGFSDAVMDANGNLTVGVDALKDYIKQLKEGARIKALQSVIEEYSAKIVEATKAQIEAEHALEDAQNAAAQATEKKSGVMNAQVSASDRLEAAQARYNELIRKGTYTSDELAAAELELNAAQYAVLHGMIEVNGETQNASDAMGVYANAEATATGEAENLNDEIAKNQQAVNDATKEQEKYQKELDDLLDSTVDTTDAVKENSDAVTESGEAAANAGLQYDEYGNIVEETGETIEDATQDIIDAYNKNYESAKSSVEGQGKLWQEFAKKEAVSADQIIKNLQSQQEAYSSWNDNVSTLVNSGRYQHDAAFRAMVDSLIDAGIEMAPYMQTIVDLYQNGDQQLEEIMSNFGGVSAAADQYEQTMATFQTIAEHGIEAVSKALGKGSKTAGKEASNTTKAISSGYRGGKGDVESASSELGEAATTGVEAVENQKGEAESAGKAIGSSISSGVRAQRADINSAFTSLRTAISTNITSIQGLKSSAKAAGSEISSGLESGISANAGSVKTAITSLSTAVKTAMTEVAAKKSDATTAGKTVSDALASALDGGVAAVKAAGRRLGDAVGNGIGGANANATSNANKVVNAAKAPFQALDASQDPWVWGRHMGDNFANGLGSAYANVIANANKIANAAKSILGHSTPKEGPLKNDDVWGLHMAQNFAEGMRQGIPDVKMAAEDLAYAMAAVPTSTMVDIDALTGSNVASAPLTQYDLMEAVAAAAEQIDWKVVIGNREFGRILRTQGAIA